MKVHELMSMLERYDPAQEVVFYAPGDCAYESVCYNDVRITMEEVWSDQDHSPHEYVVSIDLYE